MPRSNPAAQLLKQQREFLTLQLKVEMEVLSGETLSKETWRVLANGPIDEQDLLNLARSERLHPPFGPLSSLLHPQWRDDIPQVLLNVGRTLLLEGGLSLTDVALESVCGAAVNPRYYRKPQLPLLTDLILDLCARWAARPNGTLSLLQQQELASVLKDLVKLSPKQKLSGEQVDRVILAAGTLLNAMNGNQALSGTDHVPLVTQIARHLPKARQAELWKTTGLTPTGLDPL